MPDLLTQLRTYGSQLDAGSTPLPHPDEYCDQQQPRLVPVRPWPVLIGAVVAVLLLIGVPLIVLDVMSETPSAMSPTLATGEPLPEVATSTTPTSIELSATTTSTSPASTTTTATSTTWNEEDWATEGAPAALATAEAYYAALNTGDLEAAAGLLIDNRPDERLQSQLRVAIEGANAQFTYECAVEDTPGSILCRETVIDDLYGPAGTTNQALVRYYYESGRLILDPEDGTHQPLACETEPAGDAVDFLMDLRVWSAENHPELERYWIWGDPIDSISAIPCRVYPFSRPEDAAEVIAIVPEFVAQSEEWPR